ncbi:Ldh family oxidoreductase [Mesorhizobium sp. WSM4976]|uniref:Ldh family oxidoreductase n=1 Tax=Mesorhizobium sp. WSM4976 TaxID=3038549 RepID=UPI002417A8D1|nr:Ldh family oxidoreductase [Mesorhizobium sp. WSM4976]MDG4892424.1 Ldh family oxidoreductase [Mesorhizobium sp. WSM4976]
MNNASTAGGFRAADLIGYATELLTGVGLPQEKASRTAEILVEGDMLGHTTHGLALLPGYLGALQDGSMSKDGDHLVVADSGATATWDGRRLPGPWLVSTGIELGVARAKKYGSFILAIRRSHHIGCLAAYLQKATDQGLVVLVASSDPAIESVAPFGGTRRMITPNPLAAGIPTSGEPILIDISMSTTTNAMVTRARNQGAPLPHGWLLDANGNPTSDPGAFFTDPPGSILPLGGTELGYKGFGLGLLIEALTSGLGGHGRADPAEGWGASVFIQLFDPAAFGGLDSFNRQLDTLADRVRQNPPVPGNDKVRLPGERGLALKARQLQAGLELHASIMPALKTWATKLGVQMPQAEGPIELTDQS